MLIAKIYLNDTEIDEINILNKGRVDDEGRHLYSITRPAGHSGVQLWHKRELGYEPLLMRVLHYLKDAR